MLVELTGFLVVNCSMYNAATAFVEAALLANCLRRDASGYYVLIPERLHGGRLSVLENYLDGTEMGIGEYSMDDDAVDVKTLADLVDNEIMMVYAEAPMVRGIIEERLADVSDLAHDNDALLCIGSDFATLVLLEEPASVGAGVVIGEAGASGLGTAYGMDPGIFTTHEEYLRQVPGCLVGVSEDSAGMRTFTLAL